MSATTTIEWTDRTWNPIRGCSLVSAGCANCYAMKQAHRFSGPGNPYEGLTEMGPQGPRWTGKVRLVPELLEEPLHWKQPCRVFVNSMSDLFHEDVPDEFIDQVFAVMALTSEHTYQILTKRPERMLKYLTVHAAGGRHIWHACQAITLPNKRSTSWPLPNVWLGVSVEDQKTADERIPLMLQTPAARRWISAEPLLGPIDLNKVNYSASLRDFMRRAVGEEGARTVSDAAFRDVLKGSWDDGWDTGNDGTKLDWVVVGGESGPGARPCDVAWIRSIVQQCQAAKVPCFVKQLGAQVVDRNDAGFEGDTETSWPMDTRTEDPDNEMIYQGAPLRVVLKDKKGGDPAEWPEDLRVRQYPNPAPDRGMR